MESDVKGWFIPAGAGNTGPLPGYSDTTAVHPRWRGEHPSCTRHRLPVDGSSPLARGTRLTRPSEVRPMRFIPAGAGNTWPPNWISASVTVHPRWRGEHIISRRRSLSDDGSSPLARGTPHMHHQRGRASRFIPAGAGNTTLTTRAFAMNAVHPRWRGEHEDNQKREESEFRFIPAGAGNTSNFILNFFIKNGSSPLARGTQHRSNTMHHLGRFIPAGAGNTVPLCGTGVAYPVHPRWRGEHWGRASARLYHCGSSPLARGTRLQQPIQQQPIRFIPAGAGNTTSRAAPRLVAAVHPRWRGEHYQHQKRKKVPDGSSPLARGTPIFL